MEQTAPVQQRSLVVDGPPAWIVAIIFAGLLAVSWGADDPGAGLAVFAVGIVVALAAGAGIERARAGSGLENGSLRWTGTPRPPPAIRPRRVP